MCPPETLASMRSPEISRRNLLKFGLGAAVAAALPVGSAHAATVRRTTFRNVVDLTHVLGTQFPLFPERRRSAFNRRSRTTKTATTAAF